MFPTIRAHYILRHLANSDEEELTETMKAEIVTPVKETDIVDMRVHRLVEGTLIAIAEMCGAVIGLNDFVYLATYC